LGVHPARAKPLEHEVVEGERQVGAVDACRREAIDEVRERGHDEIEPGEQIARRRRAGELAGDEASCSSKGVEISAREERGVLDVDDVGVVSVDLRQRDTTQQPRAGARGYPAAAQSRHLTQRPPQPVLGRPARLECHAVDDDLLGLVSGRSQVA
jgi:hypothetical protein